MRTNAGNAGASEVLPTGRLDWVDTGRGLAILLVALFHSTNWLLAAGAHVAGWVEFNLIVSSLRMPLFFVLSGLFAGKWLTTSWGRLWQGKLRMFVWVFLVWSLIGAVIFTFAVRVMKGEGSLVRGTIIPFLVSPAVPRLELWFIWALVVFFALAKLTRKVDPRLQLAVAAVASAVALSGWVTASPGWNGGVKYYAFFLAGLYGKAFIIRLGQARSRALLGVIFAAWLGVSVLLWRLDAREIPGLYFVNCVLGVGAGVALSRMLSFAVLRRIGSQTLPIYLAHTPLAVLLSVVLYLTGIASIAPLWPVLPPVIMLIVVWGALQVKAVAPRLSLGFLYTAPSWFPGGVRQSSRALAAADQG